ncbi:MAG: TetR/AcrR family transcriptional regulator C-terminal domain-containing protein [Umezawaea sp.]
MVVYAGQGDARRSMDLMWGHRIPDGRTAPGPKPALSVEAIIGAAIGVADDDGMSGLSMRAVGERLGRTAMALYTYVPTKGDLVDLMYDRVLGELPTHYEVRLGWRGTVTSWAEDRLEFHLRHPWTLQVSQARPVLGPNEFAALETVAEILHKTDLGPRALRGILGVVLHFVRGQAQTIAEARSAAVTTGVSDEEWWYARSPLLAEVAPDFAQRFPMAVRMEAEKPDPGDGEAYLESAISESFEVGLEVILDGIDATIAKARR